MIFNTKVNVENYIWYNLLSNTRIPTLFQSIPNYLQNNFLVFTISQFNKFYSGTSRSRTQIQLLLTKLLCLWYSGRETSNKIFIWNSLYASICMFRLSSVRVKIPVINGCLATPFTNGVYKNVALNPLIPTVLPLNVE